MKKAIKIIILLVASVTFLINGSVYLSMKAQKPIREDKNSAAPKFSLEEVERMLPPIPNVDVTAMPLEAYKVTYYLKEERVQEALAAAEKADSINPYTRVGNYFRAKIFNFAGLYDEAKVEAEKAFYEWPKNIEHYKVLNEVLVGKLDTTEIKKVFKYADSLFPEKKEYKEDFQKSLNMARAGYIIKIYLDAVPISQDSLVGQWQRMYEYSYGKVVYDPNTVLSFSKEGVFKDTKGGHYKYSLEESDLNLFFIGNGQKIKTMNLSYSQGNNTLLLLDTQSPENKPQYFKKIASKAVEK